MPTITRLVEDSQKYVPAGRQYTGIQVWLACSGIAHGNSGTNLLLLERKRVDHGTPHGATYLMTSSVTLLAFMFQVGVDYLEALRVTYLTHCKRTPAGTPSPPTTS